MRVRNFRPVLERLEGRLNPTSPHFISATSGTDAAGDLIVKFKEAGLGDNVTIDYELTGDAAATFQFANKGGNVVQGTPFFASNATLATGSFTSGKNGNIVGILVSPPPGPNPADLKVINGRGWTQIETVSWTNLVLTDTTNSVAVSVPDVSTTIITPVGK